MKSKDLIVGKMYGNGLGTIRELLEIDNSLAIYRIVKYEDSNYSPIVKVNLPSFARWAKYESLGFVEKKCLKTWRDKEGNAPTFIKDKIYIGELKKLNLRFNTFCPEVEKSSEEWNFHSGSDYFNV